MENSLKNPLFVSSSSPPLKVLSNWWDQQSKYSYGPWFYTSNDDGFFTSVIEFTYSQFLEFIAFLFLICLFRMITVCLSDKVFPDQNHRLKEHIFFLKFYVLTIFLFFLACFKIMFNNAELKCTLYSCAISISWIHLFM